MKRAPASGRRGGCSRATDGELEKALAKLTTMRGGRVEIVTRSPSAYHSTFPVERLAVRCGAHHEQHLIFKDLSRTGPSHPAWQLRAPFLRDPLREIVCYRDVLSGSRLSTAACLGASVSPRRGRYWLFLERLVGDPLWQRGETRTWCRAAAWLAEMHAGFAGRAHLLPRRFIVHDERHWRRWLRRARTSLQDGHHERHRPACSGNDIRWLIERAKGAAQWLTQQPATLIHGDFHPSNILVENHTDGVAIRPIDWEMAGVGPGTLDLAALTSGRWDDAQREAVISAYRDALPRRIRPPLATLRGALRRCRLLLAVQWLGWSADWEPPPEHDHDWLVTAFELAGRRRKLTAPGRAAR